jgi:uncharacterized membrane protein (UPF0127 family)
MLFFMFALLLAALLRTSTIEVGGSALQVEIADTATAREKGLMGRSSLEEGQGMLFIYERSEPVAFWMKNTKIPLSVAYFDSHKKILNILDMEPESGPNPRLYPSDGPVQYALEVPKGWFSKRGIRPGMKFSFLDPVNSVH